MSTEMWSNSLFGCFSDIGTCVIAFIVPWYIQGKNAEAAGEPCLHHGLAGLVPILGQYCHAVIRGKIREQKSIEGTFFSDIVLSFFCGRCALVQEAQEIKTPAPLAMARE
ncbi:uncharacterized protein LOC135337088 [Halichondria panicea]|uniref:uncharacterized protein LOC135337088 n=1 Tax=Halichondria panicea TaxID=6063 RepID=UPI00312B9579